MSMMLLLAVTAAVAASMGYLAARRGDEEGEDAEEGAKEGDRASSPGQPAEAGERREGGGERGERSGERAGDPFADLALSLGDVVTGEREERWLAGALVAREGSRVVGALFLAPEGAKLCAVASFPAPRREIYWMDPATLDSPDEPPATVELDGTVLRRKGRLPVALTRVGQNAPKVGEAGIWATYEGSGREVAVVITSGGRAWAWKGSRLDEGEYDRLGKGGDD